MWENLKEFEGNLALKQMDGKIYADITWLRPWPKNPRKVEEKDLTRLKKQIIELDVYKPLLITPDGEILGGNQRFKCISELHKEFGEKYAYIWVSVVDAWTDEQRLKYALSDNDNIGRYTREQLSACLQPFMEQPSMFKEYNIEIGDKQGISKFLDDLVMTEKDLRMRNVSKELKELGINEETIENIEQMATYSKKEAKIEDVNIVGTITGQRYPIMFWVDKEEDYELLKKVFDTGYKNKYNTEKLLEITKKYAV